jgi:3-deoxy-D-manno-octulosonic-acid transferase
LRWSAFKKACAIPAAAYPAESGIKIVLLDTLGDLERVYSFCRAAYVGGTLLPEYGGHSPMEAAAYSAALVLGPYFPNIRDVAEELIRCGAAKVIRDSAGAGEFLKLFGREDDRLREMGAAAFSVWQASSGSTGRIWDLITSTGAERPLAQVENS